MANIVVRPYELSDEEGYYDVNSLTYNDGRPYPPEQRIFRFGKPYVAVEGSEVVGAFNLLDMTATRQAAVLDCAGVAGVAVMPHRRRGGVGSAMLSWIPRHLRERGIPLTHLYAFRETFYRKFGYEVCGKRIRIECSGPRLPRLGGDLPVRRLTPADWRELAPCFEAFAKRRSGVNVRTEKLWMRVLNEHRPLAIYAVGDPVEGYVAVSHSTAFWTTDHLSEVAWCTRRGYENVVGLFHGLAINKSGLSWFEPSDSPFYARFLDQGVEAKLDRPIMFRVTDVPAALRQLKPASSGEFTLKVQDDLIEENRGPWRVAFGPDGVAVEPASEADLEIDIRHFAQAFLGDPSWTDLARLDLAVVRDAKALEAALALMPATPVYCPEFF